MIRKHLSVFSLYIRATLLPMLLLLLLSMGACALLFMWQLRDFFISTASSVPSIGLESLMDQTVLPWIVAVALLLLTVLLCIQGSAFGSSTSYTVSRLRVSEKAVFLWQALFNTLAYFVFWAIHAVLLWSLCTLYAHTLPDATSQTVLLALYRQDFLHILLPLHDASLLIRNIAFCLALGVLSAHYTHKQRNGKAAYGIIVMLVYVLGSFAIYEGMGNLSGDIVGAGIALCVAIAIVVSVLTDDMRFLFEDENDTRLESCNGISYKKEES